MFKTSLIDLKKLKGIKNQSHHFQCSNIALTPAFKTRVSRQNYSDAERLSNDSLGEEALSLWTKMCFRLHTQVGQHGRAEVDSGWLNSIIRS